MLRILRDKARKEGLSIEVRKRDMRRSNLRKRFPLVIMPFDAIGEIVEIEDHLAVLAQVKQHLRKNGRFILTTHNFHFSDTNLTSKMPTRDYVDPRTGHRIRFSGSREVTSGTHTGISYQRYKEYDQIPPQSI